MKTNIVPKLKRVRAQNDASGNSKPSTHPGSDGDEAELPTRDTQFMDLRARLQRLNRKSRFSVPMNLRTLATLWARDYVSQVFPSVQGPEEIRLLLSAETSFIAASEMARLGIKEWQKLVNDGRNAKEDFPDI